MRLLAALLLVSSLASPALAIEVTGWVLDEVGAPLAGARVAAHPEESLAQRYARWMAGGELPVLAETAADAKGRFVLDLDFPFALRVNAPGREPYAPMVPPDGRIGAIVLHPAPMIAGSVSASGKPIARARIAFATSLGAEWITTSAADGTFEAPSPAVWTNSAWILHPDVVVALAAVPRAPAPLHLAVDPPKSISGTLVAPDGSPVPGVEVLLDEWPLATTDDGGRFTILHALPFVRFVHAEKEPLFARAPYGESPIRLALEETHALEGVVRDASSNEPAPFAMVMAIDASRTDPRAARADARGRYRIERIPAGTYSVVASLWGRGFPDLEGRSVSIPADGPIDAIAPPGQPPLQGLVVDEKGRPIAGASVVAMSGAHNPDPRYFRNGARSAPDGSFRFLYPYPSRAGEALYLYADAGGIVARSDALAEAPDRPVTIVIPAAALLTVAVHDAAGKPVEGAAVTTAAVSDDDPKNRRGRPFVRDAPRTGTDGTLELRLAPGVYDIAIDAKGFVSQTIRGHRVEGASRADIALAPGAPLRGRIVRTDGTPVAGALVNVSARGGHASAETAADGSFFVAELPPGTAELSVGHQEHGFTVRQTVTIPQEDLVIEAPLSGSIAGRVTDRATGAPIPRLSVGISRRSNGGLGSESRTTEAPDGTFVIPRVAPGEIVVTVSAPGYVPFRGEPRRLAEGETIEALDVKLDRGAAVRGRVTGPDGEPVEGARTVIELPGERMGVQFYDLGALTDANGEYVIPAVESGTMKIRFSKSGFLEEVRTIEVAAADLRADAQLSKGAALRGRVVDGSGLPIAGAKITARSFQSRPSTLSGESDASGEFAIEGVARGLYDVEVRKEGYATASPRQVDPYATTTLTIALGRGAVIHGRVRGLPPGMQTDLNAQIGGLLEHAAADAEGNYRIEDLPAGEVAIRVIAHGGGDSRSSRPKRVTIAPGEERRVDFDLGGSPVRGRVTRNGAPAAGAQVVFWEVARDETGRPRRVGASAGTAAVTTDASGSYEVTGLEPGLYLMEVRVERTGPALERECRIGAHGCDADVVGAPLEIAVVDSSSREPVAGASISLRPKQPTFPASGNKTSDSEGVASFELVPSGAYELVVKAQGYPAARRLFEEAGSPQRIEVAMIAEIPTTLRVVDAATARPLNGNVLLEAIEAPRPVEPYFTVLDGAVVIPLPPGTYRAVVQSSGFAPRTIELRLPQQAPVEVALTGGGDLVIVNESRLEGHVRITRADSASGIVAASMPRDCILRPAAADAAFRNLEPGRYRLALTDAAGKTIRSADVELRDNKVLKVTW